MSRPRAAFRLKQSPVHFDRRWYWELVAPNGLVIAKSSHYYVSRRGARVAVTCVIGQITRAYPPRKDSDAEAHHPRRL